MKNISFDIIILLFLLPLRSLCGDVNDSLPAKHEFSFAYEISADNSVGLNYGLRISQNNRIKFGLNLGGDYYNNAPLMNTAYPTSGFNSAATFLVGFEHNRAIKSDFVFISGANLRLNMDFNYSKVENPSFPVNLQSTSTLGLSPGLAGIFGIYYKISENFLIGSSHNPLIIYDEISGSINNSRVVKMYLTNISVVDLRYRF